MRTSLHDSWGMSLLYRHPRVDNKVNKDTKVDPKDPQVPLEVCVASLVEGAPASHLLRPGETRPLSCGGGAGGVATSCSAHSCSVTCGDGTQVLSDLL